MSADLSVVRTDAEAQILDHYKSAEAALPAVGTDRPAAIARFEATGLPHRRIESWKYTDLRKRVTTAFAPAGDADSASARALLSEDALDALNPVRLVIANGRFAADLSDLSDLGEGVSVADLTEASDAQGLSLAVAEGDVGLDLNLAFRTGGVVLTIADGVSVERPIEIVTVVTADAPVSSASHVGVRAGKGASALIIERYAGMDAAYQSNVSASYDLAEEAEIAVVRMQTESEAALHVGSTQAELAENARFNHLSVLVGSEIARDQTFVRFSGEHAHAGLRGINLSGKKQHIDKTLVVDHAVPNCDSRELYKTVVSGEATGIFQGKIVVRQHAQKTDAEMMSQALLLSEDAGFSNKPELEIYADDVVCAHGATCGELDEDLLFYLLSRGIPKAEAELMLVQAFLAEAVEEFDNRAVADALGTLVEQWLSARESMQIGG
ncbi:Fe-S cluster assembly protein SufD [Coralliovum pocilloporae]|uniref:Fe-S cluster assembly protein SufD n=1 Tax=Coralliovum pocilloporae TaxID=3066369 RepID=UPI0033074300